jgi:hypothetical protein
MYTPTFYRGLSGEEHICDKSDGYIQPLRKISFPSVPHKYDTFLYPDLDLPFLHPDVLRPDLLAQPPPFYLPYSGV